MLTLAMSDFGQFIICIALLIIGGVGLIFKLAERASRREIHKLERELAYYRDRELPADI